MSNKQPFIDKKNSVTYKLVNRYQRDPLTGIGDVPQNVLVPIKDNKTYSETADQNIQLGLTACADDYDYSKHLKPKQKNPANNSSSVHINNPTFCAKNPALPKELFASVDLNEVGLMNKPNIPYEYDVTLDGNIKEVVEATLDEDYVESDCEDYFNALLSNGDQTTVDDNAMSDDESVCSTKNYGYSDKMSRMSMISASTMRRSEKLELLDDQFDRIEEYYNDDSHEAKEINMSLNDMDEMFVDYLENENKEKKNLENINYQPNKAKDEIYYLAKNFNKNIEMGSVKQENEDKEEDYDIVIDELYNKDREDIEWDCESILSTYSNIYNRPKELLLAKNSALKKKKGENAETKNRKTIGIMNKEYMEITKNIQHKRNKSSVYTKNKTELKEMKKQLKKIKREKKLIKKEIKKTSAAKKEIRVTLNKIAL